MPSRWKWRAVAFFWDFSIFALMLALNFFVGEFGRTSFWIIFAAALFTIFYLIGAAATTMSSSLSNPEYTWYLATKAAEATEVWRSYWWGKFRYRLVRLMRTTFGSGRGDRFVRIQALRASAEVQSPPVSPEDAPGLGDLIRAFRQRSLEIRFLHHEDRRDKRIGKETGELKAQVKAAETLEDGYLRWLMLIYFSFTDGERKLLRAHKEETVWGWIEAYPTRSWLVRFAIAAIVASLVYAILRVTIFVPP